MKKIIRLALISILVVLNILGIEGLKLQVFQTERCHWADITCNSYIQELTEEVWGQAGAVAYPAAAQYKQVGRSSSKAVICRYKMVEKLSDRALAIPFKP